MATTGQRLLNAAGERILTTDGLQRNSDGTDECDTADISGVEVLRCSDDSGTGDYWQTSVALTETVYVWKDGAPGECYYVPDGVAPTTPIPGPTFAFTHAALNCTDCDFADDECFCDDGNAPDTWRVTFASIVVDGGCCFESVADIADSGLAGAVNQTFDLYRSGVCSWERTMVLSSGLLNISVNDTVTPDCSGSQCSFTLTLFIQLLLFGGAYHLLADVTADWTSDDTCLNSSVTISMFAASWFGTKHCDGRSNSLDNFNESSDCVDGDHPLGASGGTATLTAQ